MRHATWLTACALLLALDYSGVGSQDKGNQQDKTKSFALAPGRRGVTLGSDAQ